jgi:transposase InsO family protein
MKTAFCIEAVDEALARYCKPDIFNTDQGSQFTSVHFTAVLKKAEIAISMDGKGAWRDNVFVERSGDRSPRLQNSAQSSLWHWSISDLLQHQAFTFIS